MILTGKAKEDFLNFYWDNYIGKTRCISTKEDSEDFFNSLIKPLKPALIMEWFDSVGIFITIEYNDIAYKFQWNLGFNPRKKDVFSQAIYANRNESSLSAIERANEIYNSNYGNP